MSWVKDAIAGLNANKEVTVQPFGGSMRGRIESGQLVTLEPVNTAQLAIDDVIFVEWRKNYLLHLVTGMSDDQLEIGNNLGRINGWVPLSAALGRVVSVRDEETVAGTVVKHCHGFTYRVTLDSGRTVEASASKGTARDLLTVMPGDRLRIGGLWNHTYRILGPERAA